MLNKQTKQRIKKEEAKMKEVKIIILWLIKEKIIIRRIEEEQQSQFCMNVQASGVN